MKFFYRSYLDNFSITNKEIKTTSSNEYIRSRLTTFYENKLNSHACCLKSNAELT